MSRSTHTFSELEIPATAWDAIKAEIARAGVEYLERYLHDEKTIVFTGSEVGLVRGEYDIRASFVKYCRCHGETQLVSDNNSIVCCDCNLPKSPFQYQEPETGGSH